MKGKRSQSDGRLVVVTGASRTGKTLSTRREVKAATRLMVWDPKGAWARLDRCQRVTTRAELLAAVRRMGAGTGRVALVSPSPADFGYWAECAFWWGRMGAKAGTRSTCVAEEIANVTSPSKAPQGWHLLLSQGLEFGIDIFAITQRPAESDKTCIGNASTLRCFAMRRAQDRKYMAAELDCDVSRLAALVPLRYLERDMNTGILRNGTLSPT